MRTFLFLMILGGIAAIGGWAAWRRWREYESGQAARDQAHALAIETLRREALAQPEPPARGTQKLVAATRTVPAPAPVRSAAVPACDAHPGLDAAWLKGLSPGRFARVCIAYFESAGFRVQAQGRESPVDALLYAGEAKAPLMALRWSRSAEHPASSREVGRFAEAARALKLSHLTFVAQNGTTLNATKLAVEQQVTLLGTDQLAAKIAALPVERQAVLIAVSSQPRSAATESAVS